MDCFVNLGFQRLAAVRCASHPRATNAGVNISGTSYFQALRVFKPFVFSSLLYFQASCAFKPIERRSTDCLALNTRFLRNPYNLNEQVEWRELKVAWLIIQICQQEGLLFCCCIPVGISFRLHTNFLKFLFFFLNLRLITQCGWRRYRFEESWDFGVAEQFLFGGFPTKSSSDSELPQT